MRVCVTFAKQFETNKIVRLLGGPICGFCRLERRRAGRDHGHLWYWQRARFRACTRGLLVRRRILQPLVSPTYAFSPASIGEGYLRAIGIKPILKRQPNFPKEYLGYAQTSLVRSPSDAVGKNPDFTHPTSKMDFLAATVCRLNMVFCKRLLPFLVEEESVELILAHDTT